MIIARLIQGASFIELPGNHHVLLAGTPALDRFIEEATDFIAAHACQLQTLPAQRLLWSRLVYRGPSLAVPLRGR